MKHRPNELRALFGVIFCYLVLFVFFFIYQFLPNQLWSLSKWNFIEFETNAFGLAFIFYLLIIPLLYFTKQHIRKIVLIITAIALSVVLYGPFSFFFFVLAGAFYQFVYFKIKTSYKGLALLVILVAYTHFALEVAYGNQALFWYMFIFILFFATRFSLFFYHCIQNHFKKESPLDFVLYIFNPAYFIIYPHLVILPQFCYFTRSMRGDRGEYLNSAKSGVKYFGLGMLQLVLCYGVLSLFNLNVHFLKGWFKYVFPYFEVLIHCFKAVVLISGYGYLLLGLLGGLGYDIKPPVRNPLLSKNIVDFFERFFVYFKEIAFTIFYIPLSLLTRFLRPSARTFFSTVGTMVLSFSFYNYFCLGVDFCETYQNVIMGEHSILKTYALELGMGDVGIGPYYFKAFVIAIIAGFLGGIIGIQLILNQIEKLSGEQSFFTNYIAPNFVFKSAQWIVMIFVLWVIFVL